jgi:hypothetical protein
MVNHWNRPERLETEPLPPSGDRVVLPGFSVSVTECE